ncbi:hypothetical protein GW891_05525, partial [bacterium]|nr:hypothetical protein [bacterium]
MSLNYNAFGLASNSNFNKKSIEKYLDHKSERFFNEFSSKSFKATIYHELTHWIDDTLHNKFITKKIEKAKDGDLKGKLGSVNHANFEINSQIHAIKQIKREMSQEDFDDLTWENLFKKKSSLMSNFKNFKDEKTYNIFINNFVKRLHKEGLLPKKMNRIPSWLKMQIILKSI